MWLIPLIGFTFLYKQLIYYSMLNLSRCAIMKMLFYIGLPKYVHRLCIYFSPRLPPFYATHTPNLLFFSSHVPIAGSNAGACSWCLLVVSGGK